ncbi:MAG: hypothetical protein KTR31_18555 [Myxococcales bacterium]|nr:hypothetical protein [Myxococcales bacterium]
MPISVDGLQQVTVHFPVGGQGTQVPSGAFDLPKAFVLDDAPAWEAFYAVAADEPIDVAVLVKQARGLSVVPGEVPPSLTLPRGWRHTRVALRKPSGSTNP